MHRDCRRRSVLAWVGAIALAFVLAPRAGAQTAPTADDIVSSVVGIKTFINPDGRTIQNLGRERQGSGVVIDDSGLVLTIGYLMVEAHAAEIATNAGRAVPATIVGYDHDSGFGLLRAMEPLRVKPLALGKSAAVKQGDPVLVAAAGGPQMLAGARVASVRPFAGSWEYLLDAAIFTTPPHPAWSGAALIGRDGKLVGIGSLVVGDAAGDNASTPGNMFVPIDRLAPILPDLIADGRSSAPARPWLGVSTQEAHRLLVVVRPTPGGPAEKAGLERGDVIVSVGGEKPRSLIDFYRKVWALGPAGVTVPLEVRREGAIRRLEIKSIDRLEHLKLKSTF
ncbi:MAG: serine protease [Variibacter sp.]|nr:serine protease [Variibacter sp.]